MKSKRTSLGRTRKVNVTKEVYKDKYLTINVDYDDIHTPCGILFIYSDIPNVKLKPCPFCGVLPTMTEDNGLEICINCKDCGVSVYKCGGDYVKEAIKTWNKRSKK